MRGILTDAMVNAHCHLREGEQVYPLIYLAMQGGVDQILYMPNTDAGLKSAKEVLDYDDLVLACAREVPTKMGFVPTVMINENTTNDMIDACITAGIKDAKVYPLDRTTKSHNGVRHYARLLPVIQHCGMVGMRVHFHPEHPWMTFDNRDAEYAFLPIVDMFLSEANATIIWEHGTDGRCIPFWKKMAKNGGFYVTLTAHHLATDENESFGDVRSTCKPPLKTFRDRMDLVALVEEDHSWVMAGLDDAPHPIERKHVHQGKCACGAFTTPFGHQLYAHALHMLLSRSDGYKVYQRFTSRNARALYGLPAASRQVRLVDEDFVIPMFYEVGDWLVEPFWAGQKITYSLGE